MADSRVYELQATKAAIRKEPLDPQLRALLETVAAEVGVEFEVTSGGQSGTRRTGSARHDHGKAADVKAFVTENGTKRYLSISDPTDQKVWAEIVKLSAAGGATGIGAGRGYMGDYTAHIGFGKRAVWGAGGKSSTAPLWLTEAYKASRFVPPLNVPKVASATDTKRVAPQPLDMPQSIKIKRGEASVPRGFYSPKTGAQVDALYAGIVPGKTVLTASSAKPTPKAPVVGLKLPVTPAARVAAPMASNPSTLAKPSVTVSGKTVAQIGQEADNARLNGYRAVQEAGPSSKGAKSTAPAPTNKSGVIKTTAPEQQPIPRDVVPKSVQTPLNTPKPPPDGLLQLKVPGSTALTAGTTARGNIQSQRDEQLAQRKALSAEAASRAAAARAAQERVAAQQKAAAEAAAAQRAAAAQQRLAAERARQQAEAAARAKAMAQVQFYRNGVANPSYRDYSSNGTSEGGGQMAANAFGGNGGGGFTDSLGGRYYDRHL